MAMAHRTGYVGNIPDTRNMESPNTMADALLLWISSVYPDAHINPDTINLEDVIRPYMFRTQFSGLGPISDTRFRI